jgi:methionyl aminopeptidase
MKFIYFIFIFITEGNNKNDSEDYNPWPYYQFTGKLHPAPREHIREVPESIARPDYALHPTGIPLSEQALRGSAQIKVLSDEEIEGMRIACKVFYLFILF